jgi:hypothetical protein
MYGFWYGLTFVLLLLGFIAPIAWIAAFFTLLIAVGNRPPGRRPDGKYRTGGLLGGLWDSGVIAATMRDCPHCLEKIPRKATVCRHCGRDVVPSR